MRWGKEKKTDGDHARRTRRRRRCMWSREAKGVAFVPDWWVAGGVGFGVGVRVGWVGVGTTKNWNGGDFLVGEPQGGRAEAFAQQLGPRGPFPSPTGPPRAPHAPTTLPTTQGHVGVRVATGARRGRRKPLQSASLGEAASGGRRSSCGGAFRRGRCVGTCCCAGAAGRKGGEGGEDGDATSKAVVALGLRVRRRSIAFLSFAV